MTGRRLDREALRRDLHDRAFDQAPGPRTPGGVGIESEWIPVAEESGRVLPMEAVDGPSTAAFLRRFSRGRGWSEGVSPAGSVTFRLPSGGALSFEPGGQLEYSGPPSRTIPGAMADLDGVMAPLLSAAASEGIRLLARGIDPLTPVEDAPLHVESERYRRMSDYLDGWRPAGRRMMRQTAAFQLNVDIDADAFLRWSVACRLAPVLTAVFANSPVLEGRETNVRSNRARQWRELDASRTGIPWDDDPVAAYLELALGAPAFLLGPESEPARPFREWLDGPGAGLEAWRMHLSTLFPEVRPRGYLEFRCLDALPLRWSAVPAVVVTGLLYDPGVLREAALLLEPPEPGELDRSARDGIRDPARRARAVRVLELGLAGAERLGERFVGEAERDAAERFLEGLTRRGLDPGDEEEGELGLPRPGTREIIPRS